MKKQNLAYSFLSSLLTLGLLLSCIQVFVACNPNSGGGSTIAVAPNNCAVGTTYTQYGCLSTTSCVGSQSGYGFYPTTNQCYPPISVTGTTLVGNYGQAGTWYGALLRIDRTIFGRLLQQAGYCNQYAISWGADNCKSYTPAGFITISYQGSSFATVQITAGTSNPAYTGLMNIAAGGGTYGGWGNGTVMVTRTMTVIPSGAGFQLADQYGGGLIINDTNETFTNQRLNLSIMFNNQNLATATAIN